MDNGSITIDFAETKVGKIIGFSLGVKICKYGHGA
jgi:hypothetical protein